jgi:hypothetical protein
MLSIGGQMKLFRYFGSVLLLFAIVVLQSCGNNNTDTSGNLTIGTPTVTAFSCGLQTVGAIITFTPSTLVTGSVPNGVQVVVSETENGVLMHRKTVTLTDSPTFSVTYPIQQIIGTPIAVTISASIGSMNSSVLAIIPATTFSNFSGCSG